MNQHLFYGEASAFIAYLRALDPSHFSAFITALERDQPLSPAFDHAYGTPLEYAWQRFIAGVKMKA